ncbi:MAG: hypothetical protein AB8G16_03535 [Gammaproteobacteria bacterium]
MSNKAAVSMAFVTGALVATLASLLLRTTAPSTATDAVSPSVGRSTAQRTPRPTRTKPEDRAPRPSTLAHTLNNDDTAATVEAALELPVRSERRRALRNAFRELAQADGFDAMRQAEALTNPGDRHDAMNVVMNEFGTIDPLATFELAQNYRGSLRVELMRTAVHALTVDDPLQALETCQTLSDPNMVCEPSVYQQWAAQDPEAAMAYAGALPNKGAAAAAMSNAFRTWVHIDPDAATTWLATDTGDALSRDERFNLAASVVQEDPDAYDAVAFSLPNEHRQRLFDYKIQALARQDLARAVVETQQLAGTHQFRSAASTLTRTWIRTDPVAAASWIQSLEGDTRRQMLKQAMSQWSKTDFEAAAAFTNTLSLEERQTLTTSLANGLANRDPKKAFDWVTSLPAELANRGSISTIAQQWARADPETAMNTFITKKDQPWAQSGVSMAMMQMALDDLPGASRWASRIQDPKMAESAVRAVASVAARNGLDPAIEWAKSLSGRSRALAVQGIASQADQPSPRLFRLANSIEDNSIRGNTVTAMLTRMIHNDRATAKTLIEQARIDENMRAELRRILEQQ